MHSERRKAADFFSVSGENDASDHESDSIEESFKGSKPSTPAKSPKTPKTTSTKKNSSSLLTEPETHVKNKTTKKETPSKKGSKPATPKANTPAKSPKPTAQEIFGLNENESEDEESDEEEDRIASLTNKKSTSKKIETKKAEEEEEEEDNDDEEDQSDNEEEIEGDEEEESKSKSTFIKFSKFQEEDDDDFDYDETDEENEDTASGSPVSDPKEKVEKPKKTVKGDRDSAKRSKKSGLVYISRVPEMMDPSGMRQILSRFGEVDRLYLVPADTSRNDEEDASANKNRDKKKKKSKRPRFYKEGWAEFLRKKDAKLCATVLNGRTTIGGKNRRSRFYDTVVAVRYLKGFKWNDLAEQMVAEKEARIMKLKKEIGIGNEESRVFAESVAIAKSIEKRRRTGNEDEEVLEKRQKTLHREFDQRASRTKRAGESTEKTKKKDGNAMDNVLAKIF